MHSGQDTDNYRKKGVIMHDSVGSIYVVYRPDKNTKRVADIIRLCTISDLIKSAAADNADIN